MKQPRWTPCDPPPGWRDYMGPYRAWKCSQTGAILIECPFRKFRWLDSGQWSIIIPAADGKQTCLSDTYDWYGRSRKSPPTTWANKILAEKAPHLFQPRTNHA